MSGGEPAATESGGPSERDQATRRPADGLPYAKAGIRRNPWVRLSRASLQPSHKP
jgi:hypothetical protein